MALITRDRILGLLAAVALLVWFIIPPAIELSGTSCSLLFAAPGECEVGVRGAFALAAAYCALAGYLVKRALSRQPDLAWLEATLMMVGTTLLFALPLWVMLHAAFW